MKSRKTALTRVASAVLVVVAYGGAGSAMAGSYSGNYTATITLPTNGTDTTEDIVAGSSVAPNSAFNSAILVGPGTDTITIGGTGTSTSLSSENADTISSWSDLNGAINLTNTKITTLVSAIQNFSGGDGIAMAGGSQTLSLTDSSVSVTSTCTLAQNYCLAGYSPGNGIFMNYAGSLTLIDSQISSQYGLPIYLFYNTGTGQIRGSTLTITDPANPSQPAVLSAATSLNISDDSKGPTVIKNNSLLPSSTGLIASSWIFAGNKNSPMSVVAMTNTNVSTAGVDRAFNGMVSQTYYTPPGGPVEWINGGFYGAVGVLADAAQVSVSGGTISTIGAGSAAFEATDVTGGFATSDGTTKFASNVSVTNQAALNTTGAGSPGLLANVSSQVSVGGATITTTGAGSPGIYLRQRDADNPIITSTVNSGMTVGTLSGVNTITTGGGSTSMSSNSYTAQNLGLDYTPPDSTAWTMAADGIYVGANASATATGTLNITTGNAASAGIHLSGETVVYTAPSDAGGTASFDGSGLTSATITNSAAGPAILMDYPTDRQNLQLANAMLSNGGGDVIKVNGNSLTPMSNTTISLTGSSATALAGANVLNVVQGSVLNFTANSSTLTGKIKADSSSYALVSLTNSSTLTGPVDPVDVTVDASSSWNVTEQSEVKNLSNDGTITFVDPSSTPALTLTVYGNLASSGTITLNTQLGGAGSVSDEIVLGSGATVTAPVALTIANLGGTGGVTGAPGILVVDGSAVGEAPAANAFALSSDPTFVNLTTGVTYTYGLVSSGQNWYLQTIAATQVLNFGAQNPQYFAPSGTFSLNPAVTSSNTTGSPAIAYGSTTPSVCTVDPVTGLVTMHSVGNCTITADQPAGGIYTAAPQVMQTIAISLTPQTINFPIQPAVAFAQNSSIELTPATATSGLPVSYRSLTPSTCSVSGTTVTQLAPGTCTVEASQPGDEIFAAAEPVTRNVSFTFASPTQIPTLDWRALLGLALGLLVMARRTLRRG